MPNLAPTEPDKPPRSETRVDRLTPQTRRLVHAMVWDGLPYDQAAQAAGMHVAAARKALARPHVMALLKSEREVLRASVSPRNIHRLVQIRDAADNMPAVQAIKALEQLGEEQSQPRAATSPGICIVIQQRASDVVDVTPAIPKTHEE